VRKLMESVVKLDVPLVADVGAAPEAGHGSDD
jgi:DNA polymerase I-like protein with 3'-5' exonuclease and polymerase domains